MTFVTWNDEYMMDVQEIDVQHRKLIALVNVLHEVMKSGKGGEALGRALTELIKFTKIHFATEEAYMGEYGYPNYAVHKEEHEKLLKDLAEFEHGFYQGESLLSFAIALDLKGWAMRHISTLDKELGVFLNSKGVS